MLVLSDKWITTKCQPPDLRAWVADRAAVAWLGPDNPAAASGTSHHPPPIPGSAAPLGPPGSETHANAVGGCRRLRPIPGSTSFPPARGRRPRRRTPGNSTRHTATVPSPTRPPGSLGVKPIWGASGSDPGEPRGSLGGASGSDPGEPRGGASRSDRFRISCGENSNRSDPRGSDPRGSQGIRPQGIRG